jgi:hypothetical protein
MIEGRVGELNVMGSLSVRAEEVLLVFVHMQGVLQLDEVDRWVPPQVVQRRGDASLRHVTGPNWPRVHWKLVC